MSTTLFGAEIGFWPALSLLALVLLGASGYVARKRAVTKEWSGEREKHLASRARIFVPRLFFALVALGIVLGLSDITYRYVVTSSQYATNRLYITLDNSSSMYNFTNPWAPAYCTSVPNGQPCPIYGTDVGLQYKYPRIYNAYRAVMRIIDATEAYTERKKNGESRDQIGLLRFGLNSFVEVYGTTDYDHVRRRLQKLRWNDPRTGIHTEIHLALWDMFQAALQRNFSGADGVISLDEGDRTALQKAVYPGKDGARFHAPNSLSSKLRELRAELRDTAFIIVTDAHSGQIDTRLNKLPVSFVKLMELAAYLELPVHVISIGEDQEITRKLAENTGYGPPGGQNRGAFHLVKGETNFKDMDAVVDTILSTRFRIVSSKSEWMRESYTSYLGLSFALLLLMGCVGRYWFGREIGKGGTP